MLRRRPSCIISIPAPFNRKSTAAAGGGKSDFTACFCGAVARDHLNDDVEWFTTTAVI
jgi:hypothetical protein